jgi:hypothetical protein
MKRCLMAAVLCVLAALPAGASTFLFMSPEELVAQSEAVVQGRVVEVASFWNAEHTAILTEAVVQVEEKVLGDAAPYVRLLTFGGQVADYRIVAHGFPTFQQGERLLVFLEPQRDGVHRVLGYQQGQFRIRGNAQGQEMAVSTLDADVRVLKRDGTQAPVPASMSLAQLKSRIRETAGRVGRAASR